MKFDEFILKDFDLDDLKNNDMTKNQSFQVPSTEEIYKQHKNLNWEDYKDGFPSIQAYFHKFIDDTLGKNWGKKFLQKEMKHIKHINEWLSTPSPEEEEMNRILDQRKGTLNPEQIADIQNIGKKKRYVEVPDELEFQEEEVKDMATEFEVHGTLFYKGKEFTGFFKIPKEEDERGRNSWHFFSSQEEFEPDEDDFYNVDNLTQQIEMELLD